MLKTTMHAIITKSNGRKGRSSRPDDLMLFSVWVFAFPRAIESAVDHVDLTAPHNVESRSVKRRCNTCAAGRVNGDALFGERRLQYKRVADNADIGAKADKLYIEVVSACY